MADDFWDSWKELLKMFDYAKSWEGVGGPGHWPDCDMIQIGKISKRGPVGPERYSRFTEEELVTHMSFWSIYRSPLMLGGNLPDNREIEKKLFTNGEVLEVNQHGQHPRQLYKKDGRMVWVSDANGGGSAAADKPAEGTTGAAAGAGAHGWYVGLFNISETELDIPIDFAQLGWKGKLTVRDLWQQQDKGVFKKQYIQKIPAHGAALIRLSK
jgi:hypothetical protein